MRNVLTSVLVACLVAAGLLAFASMADCSGSHMSKRTCIASAAQGSAHMPSALADPLAHLDFHVQAVQQLSVGTVASAVLLGLIAAAFVLLVPWLYAPPADVGHVRSRRGEPPVPRSLQRLTHWLALLEKRDPALQV